MLMLEGSNPSSRTGVCQMVSQLYHRLMNELDVKFPDGFTNLESKAFWLAFRVEDVGTMKTLLVKLKSKIDDCGSSFEHEEAPQRDEQLERAKKYRQNILEACDKIAF
jgi:hypothetical protein